jgi:hypothetical protein
VKVAPVALTSVPEMILRIDGNPFDDEIVIVP